VASGVHDRTGWQAPKCTEVTLMRSNSMQSMRRASSESTSVHSAAHFATDSIEVWYTTVDLYSAKSAIASLDG
jgi:hypothetical protein